MLTASEWTRNKKYMGSLIKSTQFGSSRIRNSASEHTDRIGYRTGDVLRKSEELSSTGVRTNITQILGQRTCICGTPINTSVKNGICATCARP